MKEKIEKAREGFTSRLLKEEQDRFKVLSAADSLLDAQYQSDDIVIMSFLADWLKKAKTDTQKKVLNNVLGSFLRVTSYVSTMQTISKSATSKLIREVSAHNRLVSKYAELEKENEILKKIVKDYEEGNL